MGAMKNLLLSSQYRDVVEKYIQGDTNAIYLIDTAIGASLDLMTLRCHDDERLTNYFDYHDTRGEIDMAVDSIEPYAEALGLRAPILDEADERDLEEGYGLDGE